MEETTKFTPEMSLILEVIRRAVWDAVGADSIIHHRDVRSIPYRRHAEAWILARSEGAHTPFTCAWCCEVLGISQKRLIAHMRQLQREGVVQKPGKKCQYGYALQRVIEDDRLCVLR